MKNALMRLVKINFENGLSQKIKNNDLASLSIAIKLDSSKDILIDIAIGLSFF